MSIYTYQILSKNIVICNGNACYRRARSKLRFPNLLLFLYLLRFGFIPIQDFHYCDLINQVQKMRGQGRSCPHISHLEKVCLVSQIPCVNHRLASTSFNGDAFTFAVFLAFSAILRHSRFIAFCRTRCSRCLRLSVVLARTRSPTFICIAVVAW